MVAGAALATVMLFLEQMAEQEQQILVLVVAAALVTMVVAVQAVQDWLWFVIQTLILLRQRRQALQPLR
jgi:hypothetical protein